MKEPFNRGSRTRLTGDPHSIGLGLTLVDTIAHNHAGVLTVTPRTGGGLSCRLELPGLTAA